jgi:UDP-N-acetylglucosamine 4,6-dehydratase
MKQALDNKKLLITGGTGSFGKATLFRFLSTDIEEIRIFSRDEKKQDDLRRLASDSRVKFFLGDVRDLDSLDSAMKGVDFVFHAAALKQVPSCEFYPLEAVKTNVYGTSNVLDKAQYYGVKKVICLSTDKAVYPINAMGTSKAMMEKVAVSKSRYFDTDICVTRYGNVMASRGSVIPLFINQLKESQPLTITDRNMTRFMMTLEDAVDLVMFAFLNGASGDIFVQKAPASTIENLANSILGLFNMQNHQINYLGTRHGEKLYEVLLTREEKSVCIDLGDYFRVPADIRDLNYELFLDHGNKSMDELEDYNSHNTRRLNISEMQELLLKLPLIQEYLK